MVRVPRQLWGSPATSLECCRGVTLQIPCSDRTSYLLVQLNPYAKHLGHMLPKPKVLELQVGAAAPQTSASHSPPNHKLHFPSLLY